RVRSWLYLLASQRVSGSASQRVSKSASQLSPAALTGSSTIDGDERPRSALIFWCQLLFGRRSYLDASVAGGVGWRRPILLNCLLGCAAALSVLVAGCGNQYRPVVSAINPVGPAGQPAKYAVAISSPSASSPGLLTFVDFSGDTVLTTPQILSNPNYLALAPGGSQGYVINSAG